MCASVANVAQAVELLSDVSLAEKDEERHKSSEYDKVKEELRHVVDDSDENVSKAIELLSDVSLAEKDEERNKSCEYEEDLRHDVDEEQLIRDIKRDQVAIRKDLIRHAVWDFMEVNDLLEEYPRPCHFKIPHFQGCKEASKRAARLREFKDAQIVKVNPSLAQMHLRFLTLSQGKSLLVPSPSAGHPCHTGDFYYLLDPSTFSRKKSLIYKASSKKGAAQLGVPLNLDWSQVDKIDLVVVASVAVSPSGVRLGKGMGYAELEWGILYELGVVNSETKVITTVHDCQVLSDHELPASLVEDHDLCVDIIVTGTRIINVRRPIRKPTCGVKWKNISHEKLEELPVLKLLKASVEEVTHF